MFSNSTILEAASNLSIVNKVNDRASQYQNSDNSITRFFSSPRSILYMTVILGLVAFKLATMLLGGVLGILWKILTCKCLRKDAGNAEEVTVIEAFKSNDIFKEMDFKSLDELYKRANREKNDFERSAETIDDKYIDSEAISIYKETMQSRINDIKAVIDGHLKVLQAIDTKSFDRSIKDKSTPEKIFYLMKNSSKIKKALDKMDKGD